MSNRKVNLDLTLRLKDIYMIIDDPEFYDMLPGDGADDYILEWLRDQFRLLAENDEWYRKNRPKAQVRP